MDVKSQQTTSTEQSCLFVPEYILYIIKKKVFWIAAVSHVIFPYWFACFYRKKFPFLKKQTKNKTKRRRS